MAGTAQDLLSVARGEIGYRESFGNGTKYGQWYGMNHTAWCAIFVSWCAWRAGVPTSVIPKHAFTPAGADWFRARRLTVPKTAAQPGDIVYFKFPALPRISHIGIVESNPRNGFLITIEGNTNLAGSRTGGGVWRKKRSLSLVAVVGRPRYSGAPSPAPAASAQEDDMTPEQDARLRNVEGMLANLLGQEGFINGQWQGVDTWDGSKRKLTRLDLLRESHAAVVAALGQLGRTGDPRGKNGGWLGWPQLGGLTVVDAIAAIKRKVGA